MNYEQYKFYIHLFIHSFNLETYIAPIRDTRPTIHRRSKSSRGQRRRTSGRCKIWKCGPSAKERSSKERSFHDNATTVKARRCTVGKWARGTKSAPLAADRSTRRAAKTDTGQQR